VDVGGSVDLDGDHVVAWHQARPGV
ncbi:MAG: hypothetical protein QOD53_2060, partial [Thermoleophilaceae bacterium]|jgi:hypothetical protein|nr:hypothetical protein [Thermoleophilaceae bacterium]